MNNKKYDKIKNNFLEKHWKITWNSKSPYFSDIPLLITDKTAEFLSVKKKKYKQIKTLDSVKLKKNILELLFDLDSSCSLHLKWIYIKNKLKNSKSESNSWNLIFHKFSGIVTNDDHLWIGAKYSPSIKL